MMRILLAQINDENKSFCKHIPASRKRALSRAEGVSRAAPCSGVVENCFKAPKVKAVFSFFNNKAANTNFYL